MIGSSSKHRAIAPCRVVPTAASAAQRGAGQRSDRWGRLTGSPSLASFAGNRQCGAVQNTLALIAAATLVSCGGLSFKTARCKRTFDNCINGCAAKCESADPAAADHGDDRINPITSTWHNPECANCVDHCQTLGEKCEKNAASPEPEPEP